MNITTDTKVSRYVLHVRPRCPFCKSPRLGPTEHTDTRASGVKVQHKRCKQCDERVYVNVQ